MLVKSTVAVALFAASFAAAQSSDPFANISITSAPDSTTAGMILLAYSSRTAY